MGIAGNVVPINYGFNWLTGYKIQSSTLVNTGDQNLDYTRIGFWLLGEGEMDGLVEMYDLGLARRLWTNESQDTDAFHFHSGCDAVAGSGLAATSIGTDQGVDTYWANLPPGLQPITYNRWAYYTIKLKQLINNPPNTNQNDESVWADVSPIGLWRGNRCRFFDSTGNMTAYGFTRTGAWHFVDLYCRRKLFREYKIDPVAGAEDLPAAVRARFDFGALAETAAYCSEIMPNGMPRFAGDYSFSQKTTLQACTQQILTSSRCYFQERAGKVSIRPDKPRTSVYTFTRDNADLVSVTDADLNTSPSQYTAKFRDILAPSAATIQNIVFIDDGLFGPIVTTEGPHCFVAGDYLIIGNTNTAYDTSWEVDSVPDTDGAPVYQFTMKTRGSNYPASLGAGGLIGLSFSRFKDRAPYFQHKAMQLAIGAVGVGVPRQRNKRNVDTDFANCTWDQAARISKYQRGIALGADVSPYVGPPSLTIKAPLFAPDAANSGAVAIQIEPADVVTIDSTLSDAYAGLYEVVSESVKTDGSTVGANGARTPQEGSVQLKLRPYSDDNYPDGNQGDEPGYPDVPVLPGNPGPVTWIPLESGDAAFFTGSCGDGESFQLPDGCTKDAMICWASPQGTKPSDAGAGQHLHYITDCDAYQTAECAMVYNDGSGSTWTGDVNYCGIAWRTKTSVRAFTLGPMSYVELTLAGGEIILFGKGVIASGVQVPTPANYEVNKITALAFPKVAYQNNVATHGVASWVSAAGNAHHRYQWVDTWEGPANVFIFAVQNNLDTWQTHGNGWKSCPLPDGRRLAINGISIYSRLPDATYGDNSLPTIVGDTIPPMPGMNSSTLQSMPVTDGFDYVAGSTSAHGIKNCSVDRNSLLVQTFFYDGGSTVWGGSTSVFSLLCDTPTGTVTGDAIPADASRWPG